MRTVGLESLDGRPVRLGVDPSVGYLFGPGVEELVEGGQALDALVGGFGHEGLTDEAVEALLLARPSGE